MKLNIFDNFFLTKVEEIKLYDKSLKLALEPLDKLNHYNKIVNDIVYNIANETARKQMNNKQTNCPNCGAPIIHNKCDYCGTRFCV